MRLLLCRECKTLEEIPDYEGPVELDHLLNELVRRHNEKDAQYPEDKKPHDGPVATLMKVENRDWELHRGAILERMRSKDQGFGEPWIQEAHNTYKEDAHRCWIAHRKPGRDDTLDCPDYRSDNRRIGRPTPEGRKVVKELYKLKVKDPHICDWCPYETTVQTRKNWDAGLYK